MYERRVTVLLQLWLLYKPFRRRARAVAFIAREDCAINSR